MKENGILLYSKNQTNEKFQDDILVGFFASIANFSREALNTAVQNIDLGNENKLVLAPIPDEQLLAAAIVSEIDNEELISSVLRDITRDFIDEYAPNYIRQNINPTYVDEIFDKNTMGRQVGSKFKRFVLSWLVLLPMSVLLMFLSSMVGDLLVNGLGLYQEIVTFDDVLSRILPGFFLIATAINLVLFVLPNFVNGYIVMNRKIMYFNMVIYVILSIVEFLGAQPIIAIILIAYIPLVLIICTFFCAQGYH
ncbi:MAG: hypothetical protein GF364_04860, partial [Candidatus Lokiarchaeota archaeon]|nr:hypothetical protein [Candidatus Lokiarchaeota archaeon]